MVVSTLSIFTALAMLRPGWLIIMIHQIYTVISSTVWNSSGYIKCVFEAETIFRQNSEFFEVDPSTEQQALGLNLKRN